MIGVDTNVLVRIFASDDAQQAASAIRVIDESKPGQIFVNVVVLAEFAWTMRRAYKWDDDWIRHALTRIVRHPRSRSNTALASWRRLPIPTPRSISLRID